MLVYLEMGKKYGIRLNNLLRYEFADTVALPDEQFMYKKTYKQGDAKPITSGTFAEKLEQFDMSQTVIEKEILEEYTCIDKDGSADEIQIVIREKDGVMTAEIDFRDVEQFNHFVAPLWLIRLME